MGLSRRTFLQQTGLVLTTWGVSQFGLAWCCDRYQQALAQPTRRKLALLVGINQYPESVCDCVTSRGAALSGSLTDVELQHELLVYRFGFQPSDILTLTDQAATREAIETAFFSHLIQQARPGDIVVFHFSGLGSRLRLDAPTAIPSSPVLINSLVPVDGLLPTTDRPWFNELPEDTLGLLIRSLPTDQTTTVLDLCCSDLGRVLQGNLRIRSRPNAPTGRLHPTVLALQERLARQTGVSLEQIRNQWRSGQLPGLLLTATTNQHIATEGQWDGFSAGLFTYALTQQLWEATPATTLQISFNQAVGIVQQVTGSEQQPQLIRPKRTDQSLLAYETSSTAAAGGTITAIDPDNRTVQLWLAGLPATVLENSGPSVFSAGEVILQLRSREGLQGKARLIPETTNTVLQIGQPIQERVRILPHNINLTVALDPGLERIERVDATNAFAAIPRVSSVIAGEQPADFLFGKTQLDTGTLTASSTLSVPPTGLIKPSYGLFYLGRNAILSSLSQQDEAVKTAVHRLKPQLQTLLATKLLRLTENHSSSRLGVQVTLEVIAPQERMVMQQKTMWAAQPSARGNQPLNLTAGPDRLSLPLGSRIQYRLTNDSDRPLHFLFVGLDPHGMAMALVPLPTQPNVIPAGQTLTFPAASTPEWVIQGSTGLAEVHVICSSTPFVKAYQLLNTALDPRQFLPIENPLELAHAVLEDLSSASAKTLPAIEVSPETYALDVNAWATLSFLYQIETG
jgi:hypothetical protein